MGRGGSPPNLQAQPQEADLHSMDPLQSTRLLALAGAAALVSACYLPPRCLGQGQCCLHGPAPSAQEAPQGPAPQTPAVVNSSAAPEGQPPAWGATAPDDFEVNWKERMTQPYVYLEYRGDYRDMGDTMRRLLEAGQTLQVNGPPFALFYDDPATTPVDQLRARACLPVPTSPTGLPEGMRFEVLPRAMVVYARVRGPYNQLGRSYRALFDYMRKLGWKPNGPIRELYLVNPGEGSELVGEVQVPCLAGG